MALVATNWHWSRTITKPNRSSTLNIDGAGIAALFCAVALVVLSIRLYGIIRALLDRPVRVPRDAKLVSWAPALLLLPLFFSAGGSFVTNVTDTTITTAFGYGSGVSPYLFVLAALLIGVFQMLSALTDYELNLNHDAQ